MSGKRERCSNCGKPMRRLYMQKEKDTGTRGMVASGWLCEICNFSDIITKFNQRDVSLTHHHSALNCKCQICGTSHKKGTGSFTNEFLGTIDLKNILKKLSNPKKRIDGLILINNLDNPSEYLGLVLGTFIWSNVDSDTYLIAKDIFTTHATILQKKIIDSTWKKSWKRKGWIPLQRERFMKKIAENSINLDQIFGMGIIMNQRITESTFKAIEMMKSPEIYVDNALKNNYRLAEKYAEMAMNQEDHELAGKYTGLAIRGGNNELLGKYVEIKGQDAAELIIEQLNKRGTQLDYWELRDFHEALAHTGAPEAALELIKIEFGNSYKRYLYEIGNENSEHPIIRALADLPSHCTNTDILSLLVSHLDDYESIEFLTQYYKEPKNTARLFSEVIASSGDYEKTRKFIREAAGINSSQYKNYLIKKDPEGIMKLLFSHDAALRLKGTSIGKPGEFSEELKEFIFVMSFLDSDKSVREGATELVKKIGSSEITSILNQDGFLIFEYWNQVAPIHWVEALERLIDYNDPRFLPIIIKHLRPRLDEFKGLNKKVNSLLKTLNLKKEQRVDILLEMAMTESLRHGIMAMGGELLLLKNRVIKREDILSSTSLINYSNSSGAASPESGKKKLFTSERALSEASLARNAVTCALTIDKTKTTEFIRENMEIMEVEERTKRKEGVNRRLMFVDIFAEIATSNDIPYIHRQMKKDRSPRVKRKYAEIIMALST